MLTNTSTHKHIYTDKSIQRYTNKPTRTNQQRDRSVLDRNDQCLISTYGTIGAWLERLKLMGLAWSELMGLAWSELVRSDQVWSESWSVFESLIGAWPVWFVFKSFARNKAWLDRCLIEFDWRVWSVLDWARESWFVFKSGYRDG